MEGKFKKDEEIRQRRNVHLYWPCTGDLRSDTRRYLLGEPIYGVPLPSHQEVAHQRSALPHPVLPNHTRVHHLADRLPRHHFRVGSLPPAAGNR